MGSPSAQRRNKETSPFRRSPQRQSAPQMGKKSVTSAAAAVRKSSPIGSSEEMRTKYDKFAELQRRRKALESTSDENLSTTTLQRHSIEDSLRRSVPSHEKH